VRVRNKRLLCRNVCVWELLCRNVCVWELLRKCKSYCVNVLLLCRIIRLLCGNIRLFCANVGLFGGNVIFFIARTFRVRARPWLIFICVPAGFLKSQLVTQFTTKHNYEAGIWEFVPASDCSKPGRNSEKLSRYSRFTTFKSVDSRLLRISTCGWQFHGQRRRKEKFSKVYSVVILYSKLISKMTFENFCLLVPSEKSAVSEY